MAPVFRWAIWGKKRHLAETLPYSVATFRRAFGDDAQYVIYTDEPSEIRALLQETVDVFPFGEPGSSPFDIESRAKWRKWRPAPRLFPGRTEFFVDADVFLIADPVELRRFDTDGDGCLFLVLREAPGIPHRIGQLGPRILEGMPPINTGLLGQRAGADITTDLLNELRWWQANVPVENRESHDNQGAIAAILARHYLIGQLALLPQDRYRIVSPTSNADLQTVDGIVAIHATYPDHPAFYRFRTAIEAFISGALSSEAIDSAPQEI